MLYRFEVEETKCSNPNIITLHTPDPSSPQAYHPKSAAAQEEEEVKEEDKLRSGLGDSKNRRGLGCLWVASDQSYFGALTRFSKTRSNPNPNPNPNPTPNRLRQNT